MIIQTVYKPEEVLDYLEDWFIHHMKIGFTHFYMYDNSGSIGVQDVHKEKNRKQEIAQFSREGKNKYGIKMKYNPREASERQHDIFKRYPVTRIDWKRKNEKGDVVYKQLEAVSHFSDHIKSDLCAFIDVDEFIIKKEEFKVGYMCQRKFRDMHFYDSVHDCHEYIPSLDTRNWARKVILDMADFPPFDASRHNIHFNHLKDELPITQNIFNHYNYNEIQHRNLLNNINLYSPNWIYKNEKDWSKCFEHIEKTGLLK